MNVHTDIRVRDPDVSDPRAPQAEPENPMPGIESERRWLHTVLDPLPIGVLLFDRDGRVSFNRQAERLFGMSLSPTGGSAQYAELIHFRDGRPVPYEALPSTRALRGETVHATEQRVHRADGSAIPVLASAAPIPSAGGDVAGCVLVFSGRIRARSHGTGDDRDRASPERDL